MNRLTAPDNKTAYEACLQLMELCEKTAEVYPYWEQIVPLLESPKSLQRNRGLILLAALAKWDSQGRFETIIDSYLQHVTDEKPVTARQCIQCLPEIGVQVQDEKEKIVAVLENVDTSRYAGSMKPLVEKNIRQSLEKLQAS